MASATCRLSQVSTVGSSRRRQPRPGYNFQAHSGTESRTHTYGSNAKSSGCRSGIQACKSTALRCGCELPFPTRSKWYWTSHQIAAGRFASSNTCTERSDIDFEYPTFMRRGHRKQGCCHASKEDTTASRVRAGHDYGLDAPWKDMNDPSINLVVKFGGSSVASAERMLEVAQIVCGFEKAMPVVVLSAMGKTTNLLLQAGSEALHTSPRSVAALQPLRYDIVYT